MKPDGGSTQEMEEEPGRLFVELGMLVIDGRQPDISAKGRIEGPHCVSSSRHGGHVCDGVNDQCLEASKFQGEMNKLWQNSIPMCIEVMMCHDCEVGDVSHGKHVKTGVLLERWTISLLSCRSSDVHVGGQALLQAVRSYLYFSQLSAWLNISQGSEPRKIVYRVSAPGELYSKSFPQEPDEHLFPIARACKSTGVQVMVAALPRCGDSPRTVSQSVSPPKLKYLKSSHDDDELNDSNNYRKCSSSSTDLNTNELSHQRYKTSHLKPLRQTEASGFQHEFLNGGDNSQGPCQSQDNNGDWKAMENGGAIPKHKSQVVTKPRLSLPVKDYKSGYRTLQSPKVLFTYNSLSESWNNYEYDCFSLAEDLTDLESNLVNLQLDNDVKQCMTTGKTDLSMKELNLLPEESRVKFSIGHSPITLSPHSKIFGVKNTLENGDMKAIRHLNFDLSQEHEEQSNVCHAEKLESLSNGSKTVVNSTGAVRENGFCQAKFETPFAQSAVDKRLSKLSKNLQEHYIPPEPTVDHGPSFNKSKSLLDSLMKKETTDLSSMVSSKPIPTADEKAHFRRSLDGSTSLLFHSQTGLPMQSSPAPVKKKTANGQFGYDCTLNNVKTIKKVISCSKLELAEKDNAKDRKYISTSAPASTNCLLGNFEESLLNGRLEPAGVLDGFSAEIGASGSFCPKHVKLPVTTYFFSLSDDNAPSPYLGHIALSSLGRRGYHVPKKGTVQVTLFNPENAVVKMFVVMYDLSDIPPKSRTFLRQRTFYMPVVKSPRDSNNLPSYLRYLIHLRFSSSKTGKVYLHTDIRLIFSRDKFEFDSRIATYELRSFTDRPENPKYSPKR